MKGLRITIFLLVCSVSSMSIQTCLNRAMAVSSCIDLQDFDSIDKAKGYQNGYKDAHTDFKGLNGHGFDDSIHHGNTDFKSGYVDGYNSGWNDAKRGINLKACHPL